MNKEENELLVLKDICGRLIYGLKAHYVVYHTVENEYDEWDGEITELSDFIPGCKPYLRPMSSMTEEEEIEYESIKGWRNEWELVDWLNAHHFDYRGLIEKGLAIEAPKGMYK